MLWWEGDCLGLVSKGERVCFPGGPGRYGASRWMAQHRQRQGGLNKLALGGTLNSSAWRDSSIFTRLLLGQQELETACCALITHLYAFLHEMYMDHILPLKMTILFTYICQMFCFSQWSQKGNLICFQGQQFCPRGLSHEVPPGYRSVWALHTLLQGQCGCGLELQTIAWVREAWLWDQLCHSLPVRPWGSLSGPQIPHQQKGGF